jgi:hypothetical protein
MALPDVVKNNGYKMDDYNHGLYAIGFGFTYKHNKPD